MKNIIYICIALVTLTTISCSEKASNDTATTKAVNGMMTSNFKVWGNCDMCKETIEGSLKVDGVLKADWNVDSKMITVNYDTTKITLIQIQKNVAAVGYDNDGFKGDDKAYAELAECCQYDRK